MHTIVSSLGPLCRRLPPLNHAWSSHFNVECSNVNVNIPEISCHDHEIAMTTAV